MKYCTLARTNIFAGKEPKAFEALNNHTRKRIEIMDYLIYFTLALFVTTMIIFIGGYIGTFIVKLLSSISYTVLRVRLSVYGYQCFILNDRDIAKDVNCMRLKPIIQELYVKGSNFNPYCQRLSEDRLPIYVLMNWARSIAEDIFTAPIPSVKLDQWKHYWKSKLYTQISFFHTDFPAYEDHEMGCLWGAVYLWLVACFEKDINDPLLKSIMQLGCKEKIGVPYFCHFYNAARDICGEGYFLTNEKDFSEESIFTTQIKHDYISSNEIYTGFQGLSVSERSQARQIFNDVLADSVAWRIMCNEMKQRGWFKENIYTNVMAENFFMGDNAHIDQMAVGDNTTMKHD